MPRPGLCGNLVVNSDFKRLRRPVKDIWKHGQQHRDELLFRLVRLDAGDENYPRHIGLEKIHQCLSRILPGRASLPFARVADQDFICVSHIAQGYFVKQWKAEGLASIDFDSAGFLPWAGEFVWSHARP